MLFLIDLIVFIDVIKALVFISIRAQFQWRIIRSSNYQSGYLVSGNILNIE
jgi:hypothetical protein